VKIVFSTIAWAQYLYWQATDAAVLNRTNGLIEECRRDPFRGTGKPEPLRGELQGWWSRRITLTDRLVYRVVGKGDDHRLEIVQCRFHY
jgi:toxin YoeB